jgi:ribosome-associated protein
MNQVPYQATDRADQGIAVVDPLVGPSRELALRIAEVIADTPASETLVLDIHDLSSVADCFVICSGENERQLRAIVRDVIEQLDLQGVHPRRVEGTAPAGWILLDYGDVIVHVFDEDQRSFYRLEDLWAGATMLLSMQ